MSFAHKLCLKFPFKAKQLALNPPELIALDINIPKKKKKVNKKMSEGRPPPKWVPKFFRRSALRHFCLNVKSTFVSLSCFD
ncbi:MAG: hypothetical protein AUJ25_02475 [Parcubacteria group bacterium CG1_02_37_13]|nr:MAG: hypothetical protein AUJ25_02475 [Parcubacteria group bacterium CG1_02_37_13]